MPLDAHTQRLIDLYGFLKAALELCEVEVIEAQRAQGNAEVYAIVAAMGDDWGEFWNAFRAKWGIPDHPLKEEILEMSGEAARREMEGQPGRAAHEKSL
jgi:hypothetical protein